MSEPGPEDHELLPLGQQRAVRIPGGFLAQSPEPPRHETSLLEVIAILRRRAWLVIAASAVSVAGAAYLVHTETALYSATAVLRLVNARQAITGVLGETDKQIVMGRLANPILSEIQLLRSRSVIGRVVDSIGLRLRPQTPGFSARLLQHVQLGSSVVTGDTLRLYFSPDSVLVRSRSGSTSAPYGKVLELADVRFAVTAPPAVETAELTIRSRDDAISGLLDGLRVTSRSETDVVDVVYTSSDAVMAQRVVNTLVETFRVASVQAAQQQDRRRRLFLEGQLHQSDSLLKQAQLALSAFRSREQLYSSRDKLAAQQQDLMTLDMRLEELKADRRMHQALLAALQSPGDKEEELLAVLSAPSMAGNRGVEHLYRQLLEYQNSLDSLTTGAWRSAATNPDVERLRDLITSTEQKLASAVRSQMALLDARIAALQGLRTRSAAAIQSLPDVEATEVRLVQQVETLREMGDRLREAYQKARMAEEVQAGEVEIVDLAVRPYFPIETMGLLKLGMGLILGLVVGGSCAFLLEHINPSIRRPEELALMQVPGLAVIPKIAMRGGRMRYGSSERSENGKGKAVRRGPPWELVTASQLSSPGAEAYRMLRTNLIWSRRVERLKTLVITSAVAGEGKTLTAANLAVAFAHERKRVLLMDCDFRRARLHRLFPVPREPGVIEVLAGLAPSSAVVRTPVAGLFVLPGGKPGDPTSPDPLQGNRLSVLLHSLADYFDLIIIDTPPVLAVADAAILAAMADGVLLVVRAGQTHRGAVQLANQQLAEVGARVVGAILNDPRGEVTRYGRYYSAHEYSATEG